MADPISNTPHILRCHIDDVAEMLAGLAPQTVPIVAATGAGYSVVIERCGEHMVRSYDFTDDEHPVTVLMQRYVDEGREAEQLSELTGGLVTREELHLLDTCELIVVTAAASSES